MAKETFLTMVKIVKRLFAKHPKDYVMEFNTEKKYGDEISSEEGIKLLDNYDEAFKGEEEVEVGIYPEKNGCTVAMPSILVKKDYDVSVIMGHHPLLTEDEDKNCCMIMEIDEGPEELDIFCDTDACIRLGKLYRMIQRIEGVSYYSSPTDYSWKMREAAEKASKGTLGGN